MIDRTLLRFIAVGVGNTAVGLSVIFAFRQITDDFTANLLGYVFVVPFSFLTHRTVSFGDSGRVLQTFARYLPTVAIGYAVNLATLKTLLDTGLNGYVSQGAAIGAYVTTTYLLSRFAVFLNPRTE